MDEVSPRGVETIREEIRELLARARAAGAARPDATLDDVLTLGRALAHVAPTEGAADRVVGIALDGLGVRR